MAKIYTKNTWADEVLAGDEKYQLKNDAGEVVYSEASIDLATMVAVAGTAVTAAMMNNIEDGLDGLDTKVADTVDDLNALDTRVTVIEGSSGLRAGAPSQLTIASAAITVTGSFHTLLPQSGIAGNLSTINGGVDGMMVILRPATAGHTITIEHATGNINCAFGVNNILNEQGKMALLVYSAAISKWMAFGPYSMSKDPLWNNKGDLAVGTGADSASELPVGTNAQKLIADPSTTTGLKWIDDDFGINVIVGDGTNVITTGVKGYIEIPFACAIESVRLVADASGSIVVDIWRDSFANCPPTVADTITASAKPTLSSAQKAEDTTLTGWTTALAKGNWLAINVDSASTVKQVTLSILGRKTATS